MSLFALCPLTRTGGIDEIPFWARLKIYLSAENIETWKGQVTGRDRTELCANAQ